MTEPVSPPPIPVSLNDQVRMIRELQGGILDAYAVLSPSGQIVAFNRAFFALFPRRVARHLDGEALSSAITFILSEEPLDPVQACIEQRRAVRYDEVGACTTAGERFNMIVAASPLSDGQRTSPSFIGVLLVLRNVTDEAQVQSKYKQMLRDEAKQRAELEALLIKKTRELLEANDALNDSERTLMAFKKGLLLN